jgi:hypothetical protein
MKMSEVRVGMRLREPLTPGAITVTEITPRGFKYALDEARPFIPRWGMSFAKDGHEHFGLNGECLYEPMDEGRTMAARFTKADKGEACGSAPKSSR